MSKFEKGNKGRPLGAKGKSPNKEEVIKLIDYLVKDLYERADKLSNSEKIKLLSSFRNMFNTNELNEEEKEFFNTVTINIVKDGADSNI